MTREITPQDWESIKGKLSRLLEPVELQCDEYKVTLVLSPISTYRNAILPYVNGTIRGEWVFNDCEERRRFFHASTRSLLTPKERSARNKMSKKHLKELQSQGFDIDPKFTLYEPYWTSFEALRRHLIRNNRTIGIICFHNETAATENLGNGQGDWHG